MPTSSHRLAALERKAIRRSQFSTLSRAIYNINKQFRRFDDRPPSSQSSHSSKKSPNDLSIGALFNNFKANKRYEKFSWAAPFEMPKMSNSVRSYLKPSLTPIGLDIMAKKYEIIEGEAKLLAPKRGSASLSKLVPPNSQSFNKLLKRRITLMDGNPARLNASTFQLVAERILQEIEQHEERLAKARMEKGPLVRFRSAQDLSFRPDFQPPQLPDSPQHDLHSSTARLAASCPKIHLLLPSARLPPPPHLDMPQLYLLAERLLADRPLTRQLRHETSASGSPSRSADTSSPTSQVVVDAGPSPALESAPNAAELSRSELLESEEELAVPEPITLGHPFAGLTPTDPKPVRLELRFRQPDIRDFELPAGLYAGEVSAGQGPICQRILPRVQLPSALLTDSSTT
ncbi:unnamed protein product [Protopolystoma xenopodis]|uniref:Uncharacterized protein n=1 Tax=Protopolystoma xenopodis TaxID=117903 RepID=A0A448XCQ0_9PLAT|nr:unnamed protein product [Protopolystoma xenopodis]